MFEHMPRRLHRVTAGLFIALLAMLLLALQILIRRSVWRLTIDSAIVLTMIAAVIVLEYRR